jgi:hypothetical protein
MCVSSEGVSEMYSVCGAVTEGSVGWASSEEVSLVGNDESFIGALFCVEEVDGLDGGIDENVCEIFCDVTMSSVGDAVEVEDDDTGCHAADADEPHSDDTNDDVFGESIDEGPDAEGYPSPVGPLNW